MNQKQSLGRRGEDIAARYYEQRGFTIRARNWRCKAGEIDIVAVKGRCIYIIEVKTRTSLLFGQPEEAITQPKRKRLRACAALYMKMQAVRSMVRIQICAIYEDSHRISMRVYTDSAL